MRNAGLRARGVYAIVTLTVAQQGVYLVIFTLKNLIERRKPVKPRNKQRMPGAEGTGASSQGARGR